MPEIKLQAYYSAEEIKTLITKDLERKGYFVTEIKNKFEGGALVYLERPEEEYGNVAD